MCTLTWVRRSDGYTLFFNRDELRSRRPGLPPSQQVRDGIRFLAPTDPEGGGSWVIVNEHGVALTLLNAYSASGWRPTHPVSRGQLLLSAADAVSLREVWERLRAAELERFQAFTMAAFQPGEPVTLGSWDAGKLGFRVCQESGLIATSSSVAQQDAERARLDALDLLAAEGPALDEVVLDRLHRSHLPEQGALSVCMHRADATTVSLSRVTVTGTEIALRYQDGAPCGESRPVSLVLARSNPVSVPRPGG
ncbi:MAG TPA: NRDE family protein [Gemmatimonadales bacterium]|jgi:hypothetical protein